MTEFDFESIEREYERYWRSFIADQIEDAIMGSHRTETPDTTHEAKWFREGLRFAAIITRFTESTDPYYVDMRDRLMDERRAEPNNPDAEDECG